jgi:hypothetical protein
MGLQSQGDSRKPGEDHLLQGEFSWQNDHRYFHVE